MGFLLRMAFWFSLVLLALPFGSQDGQPSVNAIDALAAAREAVGDISGLCERKPEVCEIGKSAMHTVGIRAREAARIAYETLDENVEPRDADALTQPDPAIVTGGIEAIIEGSDVGN